MRIKAEDYNYRSENNILQSLYSLIVPCFCFHFGLKPVIVIFEGCDVSRSVGHQLWVVAEVKFRMFDRSGTGERSRTASCGRFACGTRLSGESCSTTATYSSEALRLVDFVNLKDQTHNKRLRAIWD